MAGKMKVPGWPEAFAPPLPGVGGAMPGMPLMDSLSGSFDFVKKLWSGVPGALPGFVVPTMDVAELDKRIKDLQAVESWLEVNANMLRATIQALEVQRNTVATLKSFGASMGSGAGDIFETMAQAGVASASARPHASPVRPSPKQTSPRAAKKRAPAAKPVSSEEPGLSGTAWLSFLQDQFNRVAQSALAPATPPGPPARKPASSSTKTAATARKRGS